MVDRKMNTITDITVDIQSRLKINLDSLIDEDQIFWKK